ncbi:Hypothetical_protein [Hexamita inflata]|uniref:Hypothetical_protein n=1 Tax=Hexamita inflata TaxID=28002 RepID=A0AA86QZV9_9EUKA|nr:Hypothetical protein HINF_LOCUS50499 [Hexamita inflata]
MTEYNRKDSKQEYNEYMIRKYEENIKDGNLEICDLDRGDPEVTNYMFLEKLNIKALKICIKNGLSVKLRNDMIKELTIRNVMDEQQQLLFYVNDLELENLEVLDLEDNNLENDQLYNLAKFKKLITGSGSQGRKWSELNLYIIALISQIYFLYVLIFISLLVNNRKFEQNLVISTIF